MCPLCAVGHTGARTALLMFLYRDPNSDRNRDRDSNRNSQTGEMFPFGAARHAWLIRVLLVHDMRVLRCKVSRSVWN